MKSNINFNKGLGWNIINSIFGLVVGLSSTVILSRLLTPSDFGTFGILLILITIAELLADSGMGGYLVKTKNISEEDYDTLFVYNFFTSVVLYLILFFTAPVIAEFYNNNSLILGIRLSSIVVVLQSISIIATANLLRSLAFKQLAIMNVISNIMGLLLAVIWAYYIGGFLALVVQSIVSVSINSLGKIWISKSIPHFRFDFKCFKRQFSFGINLMGSTVIQSISSNISNNIIAKIFDVSLAGSFIQSSKLQSVPVSLIQGVLDRTFFPILSKINDNMSLFIMESRKISRFTYALCYPMFTFIIVLGKPIIVILLGDQWIECVMTFQFLMLASFPALVKILNRNILKSLGHTEDIFLMELFPFIVLCVCFIITVYIKSYNMFVFLMVVYSFISSLVSTVFVSRRFNQNIRVMISDVLSYSPFFVISIANLIVEYYGVMSYWLNLSSTILLVLVYIKIKSGEYLNIKKQLHL